MRSREGGPQTKHPIKTELEARLQSLSHAVDRFWKHYRTPTLRSNIHVLAGKLLLAQTPAAWGKSGQLIAPRAPQESETLGWFWGHVPSSDQRGRTGACHWPDELGLHRVIQRHEHLGIFSYFTDHVFEVDKQGQGRGGGKLGLSVNVYVLLLRLSVETKQENRRVTWATLVANACSVHPLKNRKPCETSCNNTAKPFMQHLPWWCQHLHDPSWKAYAWGDDPSTVRSCTEYLLQIQNI